MGAYDILLLLGLLFVFGFEAGFRVTQTDLKFTM